MAALMSILILALLLFSNIVSENSDKKLSDFSTPSNVPPVVCQTQTICSNSQCMPINPEDKIQLVKDGAIHYTYYPNGSLIRARSSAIQVSLETHTNDGYQICLLLPAFTQEYEGLWTLKKSNATAESDPTFFQCEVIAMHNNASMSSCALVLCLVTVLYLLAALILMFLPRTIGNSLQIII